MTRIAAFLVFLGSGTNIMDHPSRNPEAVVQRCSVKKVFLEISQNSQENTSFLIKSQASGLQLY